MLPRLDYHLHSSFSVDSTAPLEALCQAAVERGLTEVAITEHVDFVPDDYGYGFFRPAEYLREVDRCRHLFGGRLTIRAGVELGDPHLYPAEGAEVLARGEFDVAIGSVHWVQGRPAFSRALFPEVGSEESAREVVTATWRGYFAALAEAVSAGGFDVLGHFDLPKRSATASHGPLDPMEYAESIRAVLGGLVERGIGLEINTSGLRSDALETCPGLTILRWYRELGGELLTIGSDSHEPALVGFGLEAAQELAERAGFNRLARFARRALL